MAFQPAPGVVKASITAQLDEQQCVNTLHWIAAGPIDQVGMAEVAVGLRNWVTNQWLPLLPSNYRLLGIDVFDLSAEGGQGYFTPATGNPYGQLASPPLPNNVTLAISLRTSRRGRSYRGRNFWPAFGENQVVNNTVEVGVQNAIREAYEQIIGPGQLGQFWTLAVLSRQNGKQLRPVALAQPVTAVTIVDSTVDSMRRRLPKRGV